MVYMALYSLVPATSLISSPTILYLAHQAPAEVASLVVSQLINNALISGFLYLLFPLLGALFSQMYT